MLKIEQFALSGDTCAKNALLYTDSDTTPKAAILYFHGGGLLYGEKTDLPAYHLTRMTESGYAVIAYDYPLAPAAKLSLILEDVCASVSHFLKNGAGELCAELPYFLWGRSAGAYLCLIAAASGKLKRAPKGILSYYGYGFLCDNWFDSPSPHYCSLPEVSEACLSALPDEIHTSGSPATHYAVYVYARQSGRWKELIYEGREKFFLPDYSLRLCRTLPCPLFCAHSMNDTDVPYSEFLELCSRFQAQRFIAPCSVHDFDRDTDSAVTHELLDRSAAFLDHCLQLTSGE